MQYKRGAIQLAALVDLLFVIVFLQFTELEVSANQKSLAGKDKIEENEKALKEKDKMLREALLLRDEGKSRIKSMEVTLREIRELLKKTEQKVDNLEKKDSENTKIVESMKKEKELLNSSKMIAEEKKSRAEKETIEAYKAVKEFLKSIDPDQLEKSMEQDDKPDKEKIMKALAEMAGKHAGQIALELKKALEIRNRIDVFEVHIFDNDEIRLRRSDAPPIVISESKRFSDGFEEYVKKGNQPKNMVLILFTHGDCHVNVVKSVKEGIDDSIIKLKALNSGANIQCTTPSFLSLPPE